MSARSESSEAFNDSLRFLMMSAALRYPEREPNAITRRKYYEFFSNLPVFIPDNRLSDGFIDFLNNLPLQNYLHSRDALVQWVHLRNNHENVLMGRKKLTAEQTMRQHFAGTAASRQSSTPHLVKLLGLGCVVAAAVALGNYAH